MALMNGKFFGARASAALFLTAFLQVCAGPCAAGEGAEDARPGYNVIMIVVDCLRADHLSLYGYGRKTSPNIDAFAGEAAVFGHAVAPAPTTLLSFASIFTSLDVSSHGVDAPDKALSDSALTLAEILKIYNYKTAAFVGGPNLNPLFKLNQGFDIYSHIDRTDASFKDTLPAALKWAKERNAGNEKFFLLAHGNDLHTPYVFPSPSLYDKGFKASPELMALSGVDAGFFAAYKRRLRLESTGEVIAIGDGDAGHLVARYDEGINYADGLIGYFVNALRAEHMLDRTVVILTADHGEGLFDHDYFFHDFNLYEDTLRVPLIIKVPGLKGREIARQVRLIDLMPTALDFAGITPPAAASGRSLVPLLYGEETGPGPGEDIISESSVGGKVIRSGRWKLIWYPERTELYDLKKDPAERDNLAEAEKGTTAALKERLFAGLAANAEYALGEPLAAGGKFAAEMKRDKAWQRALYKKMPALTKGAKAQRDKGAKLPKR